MEQKNELKLSTGRIRGVDRSVPASARNHHEGSMHDHRPKRAYPLPLLPTHRRYEEAADATRAHLESLAIQEVSDPWDLYTFQISDLVFKGETAHQSVLIANSFNYGRILVLDGSIQSASCDERLYHEMLVQPAMICHPDPRDVLIIGGGEGATLREVLLSPTVERVTMVDIDQQLVDLCKIHLPSWHRGSFSDRRASIVFTDGREYLAADARTYDVIIIDVVDMLDNGPAQKLYTRQFYELAKRRLNPGGILAVQALEFSFNRDKEHVALARTMQTVFRHVHSYAVSVPSFLSSWGFLIASDTVNPLDIDSALLDRAITRGIGADRLAHVDGEFIRSCFTMTKETRYLLGQPGPILEDGVEFVTPPRITMLDTTSPLFPIQRQSG